MLEDFLNQRIDFSKGKTKVENKKAARLDFSRIHQNRGSDFQEDFLSKYDEFSESWREGCRKMQRF